MLRKYYLVVLALFIGLGFSCVPQKKLTYLQPDGQVQNSTFYYDDLPYRLKAEDVISLNVFSLTPGQFNFFGGNSEEASTGGGGNQFLINQEGYVELPALGDVQVSELTLEEAEDKIKNLLEDYLQSPLVKITLATPFTYHMIGEVNGVGVYQTVVGDEPNLLEAIARAGDLTQFADRKNIRIVRREGGEINIYKINVLKDEVMGDPLYQIKQDDIIIVDPLKAKGALNTQTFVFGLIGSFQAIAFLYLIFSGRRGV